MKHRAFVIGVALSLIAWGFSGLIWAQCPMCRTGLINSAEGQQMAEAFSAGILFLLAAPFAIVATLGFLIARLVPRPSRLSPTGPSFRKSKIECSFHDPKLSESTKPGEANQRRMPGRTAIIGRLL